MADIEYTVGDTAITVSFLGPQGPGVPAGGTTGQALVKSSSDDYDTEWAASAAPVDSVNGEIGAVVLDAADVGAAAASHSHTLSDVTDSGGAAALEVGTTAGTVAAGDHNHTGTYATAAQGSLADSAVQPGDLSTVATTGAYSDLSGTPTLGTAAAAATGDFATAAQGSTADSAVQPGDDAATLGAGASTDGQVLTSDGLGGAAWETPASGVTDHGLLSGLVDDDHSQYALADGTRGSFATTAQGGLADSAVQPGDDADTLGSGAATDGQVLTADGAGNAAWEAVPAAPVTSVNGATGVVVLDNTDVGAAATSHSHTESDITDLGSYPDATGQPATKMAQTDGADGWTFVDPPSGGSGYAPDPSAQPDGKWLTTESGAYAFTDLDAVSKSGDTMTGALVLPEMSAPGGPLTIVNSQAGGAANASSRSANVPVGTQAGDILLALIVTGGTSTIAFSDTDGFTVLPGHEATVTPVGSASSTLVGGRWYWRYATEDDLGGSVTFTRSTGSEYGLLILITVRNAQPPDETSWEFYDGNTSTSASEGATTWANPGITLAAGVKILGNTFTTCTFGTQLLQTPNNYYGGALIHSGPVAAGPSPAYAFSGGSGTYNGTGLLQIPGGVDGTPIVVGSSLDMEGNTVIDLREPTASSHAATKQYVDNMSVPTFTADHAAGVGTLRWYNDTGSSITITGARASLSADAVDAATVVDVNVDDVSALASPISIAVGTRTTKVTDEIVIPADSYLTVDVDSVGTPGAGETLSVQFHT